jgi:hypothetical protein
MANLFEEDIAPQTNEHRLAQTQLKFLVITYFGHPFTLYTCEATKKSYCNHTFAGTCEQQACSCFKEQILTFLNLVTAKVYHDPNMPLIVHK